MPKSKNRHPHKHPHPVHHDENGTMHHKPARSSGSFTIPIGIVFGAGIALFATGFNWAWLLLGVILGATVGYIMGQQMDKAFNA